MSYKSLRQFPALVLYPYWHQRFTARDRFGPADRVLDRSSA
ncbi:hypothetical protein ACWGS9_24245 [Bradyrhizobium sp. Arg314]